MTGWPWETRFVRELTELANPENRQRAALAHLRRGLTSTPDYPLSRVGWLFRRVPEQHLTPALLAAGLFAWVKGACPHTAQVNFGRALAARLTPEEKQRRAKRFIALLDTDAEDLPYKLRQAVCLLARDGGGLDWGQLVRDLSRWSHPDRIVQKRWARDFWGDEDTATITPRLLQGTFE